MTSLWFECDATQLNYSRFILALLFLETKNNTSVLRQLFLLQGLVFVFNYEVLLQVLFALVSIASPLFFSCKFFLSGTSVVVPIRVVCRHCCVVVLQKQQQHQSFNNLVLSLKYSCTYQCFSNGTCACVLLLPCAGRHPRGTSPS